VAPGASQDHHLECIGETLVAVHGCHRQSFRFVGVKKRRGGTTVPYCQQLPHQVVRIGDAGVQPHAAGGREAVCGITGKEHTSRAHGSRDLGGHVPGAHVDHFDCGIRVTDCGAHD
jgi:hypothetical protein